ncbi:hypothetical protein [Nocardia stercoris]|uniref:Transposase (putative) YhgA-like domain-containing protein n=1 Tax=Nocardia stercoris TaxID=2483361 RepID=A0A3M2KSQ8_9NOCA|nr:hypothetical protein [Nocardia stercoris]RMI28121.1 hypothetical protein EBN03_31555 [Nocardia stercoris]
MALCLRDADGNPVLGICLEVQLTPDESKRWSWPVYATTFRARLRCPVVLLVVVPDDTTAAWAAQPIEIATPGCFLRPVVIAPAQLPMISDRAEAQAAPERAVLSAMAHGGGPDRKPVLEALLAGLMKADEDHSRMYYDLVNEVLPKDARELLEALMTMTYEYRSRIAGKYVAEGRREGIQEGIRQGEDSALAKFCADLSERLLALLNDHRVPVTAADRERIMQCRDHSQLSDWLIRAVTAGSCAEIFE